MKKVRRMDRRFIISISLTLFIVFSITLPITAQMLEIDSAYLPIVLRGNPYHEANGVLDPTLDGDGKVLTYIGVDTRVHDLVLQPDGKILVAGSTQTTTGYDFALVRYTIDGSLDPTFNGNGIVTTDFGDDDYGIAVTLQPDGKILVAGYSGGGLDPSIDGDFALARYLPNGSLDTTFHGDGKVTTDFYGHSDISNAVAVQPDGKVILAGGAAIGTTYSYYDFALARYTETGALDPSFGNHGKTTIDFHGYHDMVNSIGVQDDGKILAVGYTGYSTPASDFAIARYTSAGSLDTTFGYEGKVITDFDGCMDYAYGLALLPDGRFVVAGRSDHYNIIHNFVLSRYFSNGSLDISFGLAGKVASDFSGMAHGAYDLAMQSNGKILVAGVVHLETTTDDYGIARYNPNGSLDLGFGVDGLITTDIFGYDEAEAMKLLPDGRIVVAGYSGPPYYLSIAQYK